MIIKSQNNKARPIEIFLYLLTIAPIISVPPVLPLAENTSPNPEPHRNAPMIIDINGWLCNRGLPANNHSKKDNEADRENTPNMVFTRNLNPSIFKAAINNTILITKYEADTGISPFVAKNIKAQIPLTPPVTISLERMKALKPKPYNRVPTIIIR